MAERNIKNKREQYSKDLQAKKDELQKQVEDIALNFTRSPEQLAELAVFQSKFYSYSFRNTLLIYSQNRGASFVGSFVKFKELGKEIAVKNNEFDENGKIPYWGVKSGAKGMKIFVPAKVTLIKTGEDEWVQISKATSEQKAAAKSGKAETKEFTAFKLGTVFDISQTYIPSKYYPEIYSMGYSSQQHAQIFKGLKAYIENELKCPVTEDINNTITLRGVCYTAGLREIRLNEKLEDTQRLSTLSHELGHFLMHRNSTKPTAQCEVEADIYNIMLNSHFGIETNDVRKGHLADSFKAYKESISLSDRKKDFDTLETIFSNADKVFKETIGDIDRYVKQYIQKEKSFAEQVDDVLEGKADNYNNLKVCNTPQILLDVGCEQLPMLYTQRHLKDALKNKDKSNSHFHGLTVEQIKQLPDLIKEPAIVFDSISPSNKGIVLALNATDNDNAPLIVSVYPNGKGIYQLEKIDSNFITSIYGKDNGFENYITRAANTNSILFWDKKRSQELFSCQGLQLPEAINNLDSNIIIHQSRNIVNSKNEKISLENIGKTVDEKLLSSKVAPKCYNITGAVEELIKEYSAEKIKDCAAVSILCRQKEITDGSLVDWAKEHISKNNIDTPNLTFKKSPCKCNIKFLNAFAEKLEVSPQQNSRKVLHGEPVNVKGRTIKL